MRGDCGVVGEAVRGEGEKKVGRGRLEMPVRVRTTRRSGAVGGGPLAKLRGGVNGGCVRWPHEEEGRGDEAVTGPRVGGCAEAGRWGACECERERERVG